MQALPGGSMLSVRLPEEDVRRRLPAGCDIAANNGPQLCVASGPEPEIAHLQAALEAEGVVCRRLVTSHAFHSPMMDGIIAPLEFAFVTIDRCLQGMNASFRVGHFFA